MMILAKDTLYYRFDHPLGFEFSAGADVPAADGWVLSAQNVSPAPTKAYECSTFEAFDQLVKAERESAATSRVSFERSIQEARSVVALLVQRVADLEAEIDALRTQG